MNNSSMATYPLHLAVSTNDFATLEKLLSLSKPYLYDIDGRDDLNLTPLQIAAFLGHTSMVSLLIEQGADISANGGYNQNFSALTFAVLEGHSDIVKLLIQEGKSLEHFASSDVGYAFLYNLDNLYLSIQEADINPVPFEKSLDIFLMLIEGQALPLVDLEDYLSYSGEIFSEPATVWLEALTRYAPTQEIADRLMMEVNRINAHDSCYEIYVDAKLLLHVLPVNYGGYSITYYTQEGGGYESNINPYGFMACFTTPFASKEIDCYLNTLDVHWNRTWDAFYDLSEIYHQAILFSRTPGIFENSVLAYDLYQQGQTVLLASGWDGHAINVILDPHHEYFIVANAGDRYQEFVGGAHIYKIHNTENLTPECIYDILNNTQQINLELVYKYELGLDKVIVLETAEQEHGNCAWYSHKPAIEALLYIHFLDEGLQSPEAQSLSNLLYIEWESYETLHALESYFSHEPTLNIDAVLDILIDYQPSLFMDNPGPINAIEYHRAEYLVNVLATEQYQDDFYNHFSWKLSDAKPELIDLFKYVELLGADSSDDFDVSAASSFKSYTPSHTMPMDLSELFEASDPHIFMEGIEGQVFDLYHMPTFSSPILEDFFWQGAQAI